MKIRIDLLAVACVLYIFASCTKNGDPNTQEVKFTSSTTASYSGNSITFEDLTEGDAGQRSWFFEGGSPEVSSEKAPVVTYTTPGRYRVELTITNKSSVYSAVKDSFILIVPSEDLAALIPFDRYVKDEGPAAIPITAQGSVAFIAEDRFNHTKHTAFFDGASRITTVLNLGTSDYSISCWVKTPYTSRMMIWMEAGNNGGNPTSWLRIGDNSTTQFLRFHVGAILNFGAEARISDGRWHHIVGVREGSTQRLYLDGVKMGEQSTGTVRNVSDPDQVFKIAAQEGVTGFSNYFKGYLDDFIVYKRALTDEEVNDLYNL